MCFWYICLKGGRKCGSNSVVTFLHSGNNSSLIPQANRGINFQLSDSIFFIFFIITVCWRASAWAYFTRMYTNTKKITRANGLMGDFVSYACYGQELCNSPKPSIVFPYRNCKQVCYGVLPKLYTARSPLFGAYNRLLYWACHIKAFFQIGLFLGFSSREIGQFRSIWARIGKKIKWRPEVEMST